MTNILDKEHFNFDFLWMLRAKLYKQLKRNIFLIQKVEILMVTSKMAAS